MVKLSVVIPSWKDPLLHRTIADLLEHAQTDIEIIPVIDGYELHTPLPDDPRVRPVYHARNTGMRGAINSGVQAAQGEWIMRTDEHCSFCQGFDHILLESIEADQIVVPKRFFLDPKQWKVMDVPPVEYEQLYVCNYERGRKFVGVPWPKRGAERAAFDIDDTMAMQGSCWIMAKSWWEKVIGRLDSERYGTHYQDSHEMVFKTWKSGGKFKVNKRAWYAHKHRKFPRTHAYGGEAADRCYAAMLEDWGDYYREIRIAWGLPV